MKIGSVELKNNVFLAPMAGVTDAAFRALCFEHGCGLACTEMVSAKGILYDNANTKALLDTSPPGGAGVTAAQLFGRDPQSLADAAKKITEYEDCDISLIDINMGCPAPKIVKNGEGSALMKEPALAGRIIEAVARAAGRPVTVKMRSGFDEGRKNAAEIAKIAELSGAAAVCVHGRTREQYYSGRADWNAVAEVKRAVGIPVIGNGDVNSPESARAMLDQTGCDAVAVGRGALGDPWLFARILGLLNAGAAPPEPALNAKLEAAVRHARMLASLKGEHIAILEMRKHLAWYIKGTPGSARLRAEVNALKTLDALEEFCNKQSS